MATITVKLNVDDPQVVNDLADVIHLVAVYMADHIEVDYTFEEE